MAENIEQILKIDHRRFKFLVRYIFEYIKAHMSSVEEIKKMNEIKRDLLNEIESNKG